MSQTSPSSEFLNTKIAKFDKNIAKLAPYDEFARGIKRSLKLQMRVLIQLNLSQIESFQSTRVLSEKFKGVSIHTKFKL